MSEQIMAYPEQWAVVELMGHGQTAGRVEKPADWGGLIRVDIPTENEGEYRTEFYGVSAIYRIKFVSEEIARAYAPSDRIVSAYDAPIISREQHKAEIRSHNQEMLELRRKNQELERRLTAVQALPAGESDDEGVPF